ncbi:hypothetical protein U1Q18_000400 [Sarracenia purpurea var. burkii]
MVYVFCIFFCVAIVSDIACGSAEFWISRFGLLYLDCWFMPLHKPSWCCFRTSLRELQTHAQVASFSYVCLGLPGFGSGFDFCICNVCWNRCFDAVSMSRLEIVDFWGKELVDLHFQVGSMFRFL